MWTVIWISCSFPELDESGGGLVWRQCSGRVPNLLRDFIGGQGENTVLYSGFFLERCLYAFPRINTLVDLSSAKVVACCFSESTEPLSVICLVTVNFEEFVLFLTFLHYTEYKQICIHLFLPTSSYFLVAYFTKWNYWIKESEPFYSSCCLVRH